MIFVSGIHGVGKSYFCRLVSEKIGLKYYTASQLIAGKRKASFLSDKHVAEIKDNQSWLLEALKDLSMAGGDFILDGHFCLLDEAGVVTRIPEKTFVDLKPDRIVLLTEKPEVISERRLQRDGVKQDISEIEAFQNEECRYAREISELLNVPLEISMGMDDINRLIASLESGGVQNGG